MELGISFLKSKLARRFCLMFILCAFAPIVVLIVVSYLQVVNQLEEQSYLRLKREVKAYSLSLFDRMNRLENDLQSIGRTLSPHQSDFQLMQSEYSDVIEELFKGIALYIGEDSARTISRPFDAALVDGLLTRANFDNPKPFFLTASEPEEVSQFFIGVHIKRPGVVPFTLIAGVKPEYLWGIGPAPLLPPMTELSVYNSAGQSIISSYNGPTEALGNLQRIHSMKDLHIFQFIQNGQIYHAGISNIFLESRYQKVGWTIVISRAKSDIMSAMDNFEKTFPFIILLFLLLILYLSVLFIRKTLNPLEDLKEGTKRIARKDFSTLVDIKSDDEFEELGLAFNDMAGKLESQFNALSVLGEIDRAILSSLNRQKIVATTLHRLKDFFHCQVSFYVRLSESSDEHVKVYTMEGRRKDDPKIVYYPISPEEKGIVFSDKEYATISLDEHAPFFLREIGENASIKLLCLPLSVENRIIRALFLGRKVEISKEDELSQARKIANQLAIAIANSILVDNLEKLAKGTIEALARTVDAKSKWTSGHSERVAIVSGKMGRAMGLTEKKIETLIRGGMLHDIGKIGVPIAILDKPRKLSSQEYEEVKLHPAIGAKILEPIEAYQDILPIIAQHHERFDGSGYPLGLVGESIDIRARIMAVADVWDALVSDRPYRQGWVAERAKHQILEGKGTLFDPDVITAFLAVVAGDLDK